jgi:hypothetical protein
MSVCRLVSGNEFSTPGTHSESQVKKARLVANPGCYPTTVQIPLVPLLEKGLISKDDIIIDAKSGKCIFGRACACKCCCMCSSGVYNCRGYKARLHEILLVRRDHPAASSYARSEQLCSSAPSRHDASRLSNARLLLSSCPPYRQP